MIPEPLHLCLLTILLSLKVAIAEFVLPPLSQAPLVFCFDTNNSPQVFCQYHVSCSSPSGLPPPDVLTQNNTVRYAFNCADAQGTVDIGLIYYQTPNGLCLYKPVVQSNSPHLILEHNGIDYQFIETQLAANNGDPFMCGQIRARVRSDSALGVADARYVCLNPWFDDSENPSNNAMCAIASVVPLTCSQGRQVSCQRTPGESSYTCDYSVETTSALEFDCFHVPAPFVGIMIEQNNPVISGQEQVWPAFAYFDALPDFIQAWGDLGNASYAGANATNATSGVDPSVAYVWTLWNDKSVDYWSEVLALNISACNAMGKSCSERALSSSNTGDTWRCTPPFVGPQFWEDFLCSVPSTYDETLVQCDGRVIPCWSVNGNATHTC